MLGQSSQTPPGVAEHRGGPFSPATCAIITVSDTRTAATDKSGTLIAEMLEAAGHRVAARSIVPDEPAHIRSAIIDYADARSLDAALITGGTGISPRDQTFETVSQLLTKPLPGYGELFRMLSYQEIGSAAMLSRAVAGLAGSMLVLTMPGSTAAVRLAMEKLVLPELAHIVREATKGLGR